jgi:hypothetical protein
LQYSNTENNFKFSKGNRVKVRNIIVFDDITYEHDFIGYVTFVNERYMNGVCSSHWVEVEVVDINNKNFILHVDVKNDNIIPYSVEDEREEKLNLLLND